MLIYTHYQCLMRHIILALTKSHISYQRLDFTSSELFSTNPRKSSDVKVYICHSDELSYDINMSFLDAVFIYYYYCY